MSTQTHLGPQLAAKLHRLGIDDPKRLVMETIVFGKAKGPEPKPIHWSDTRFNPQVKRRGANPPGGY